jgi:twitching motility protein PilT
MDSGTIRSGQGGAVELVERYLRQMLDLRASDVFLQPMAAPAYRVDGKIVRTELPPLGPDDLEAFLQHALTGPAKERFRNSPDVDFAYTISRVPCSHAVAAGGHGDETCPSPKTGKSMAPNSGTPSGGRFRINLFLHQGRLGLVARLIPSGAVEFGKLNLPPVIAEMADARNGLILIVGPAGCGKSTTLAALLHRINLTRADHIVTIEDPIEFIHEEALSIIHQRQVGYDTASFPLALRHVVRQNPDVILIGEMRDTETVQTAMAAALTGHLILSTLHATNVVQAVERMLNYYGADVRRQAQADLATTLIGIVSMRLMPRAGGTGRVPTVEILRNVPLVRKLLGEGKLVELYDVMKRGGDVGMCTMNQSLVALCKAGLVREEAALPYAPNPDEFRLNMQGMYTGIESIDQRTSAQANPDEDPWKKEEEK